MSRKKTIWIPAIIAIIAAAVFAAYSFFHAAVHHGTGFGQAAEGQPGLDRPPREEDGGLGGTMTTLGTIAVFLGAGSFCWLWFKKKRRSPSYLVTQASRWLNRFHTWTGWAALVLIAVHGAYFLIVKNQDDKIYTGIAACALLLALAGYGMFIKKVRNVWMRTIHRTLGLLWLPAIVLHAGGSAIVAIVLILAVGALAAWLDRQAKRAAAMAQRNSA